MVRGFGAFIVQDIDNFLGFASFLVFALNFDGVGAFVSGFKLALGAAKLALQ